MTKPIITIILCLSITGERSVFARSDSTMQCSRPSRELSIYLVITKANKVLSLCVSLYRVIQLELLVRIIISVFSDLAKDVKKRHRSRVE